MLRWLKETQNWDCRTWAGRGKKAWDEIVEDIAWADIVVLQSVFDNRLIELIKRDPNKKVIFEFDDLLDYVPDKHPMAKEVNTKEWRKEIQVALASADVCITTNETLKNRFFGVNNNIRVFPNYIDFSFWDRPYNPNTNDKQIRLGWAGGISHQEDLEWIAPVIAKVLEKYPQVKFIYCGDGGAYAKDKLTTFEYGKDHLVEIPPSRREFTLGAKIEQWPDKLSSLQLDIAIAPLVKNEFSECKTPIKFMEYAINRTPSVCQRFMYHQVITDGVDGLLAGDRDEWFDKISMLIEDKELRLKMGEAARKTIETKHNLADHLEEWLEIIQK